MARILHIEDDPHFRKIVRDALAPEHQVQPAVGVAEARRELAEWSPDLLVIDGTLRTRGDGFEFAKNMFDEGRNVLVISGDPCSFPELPYLSKPCPIDVLRQTVNRLLLSRLRSY